MQSAEQDLVTTQDYFAELYVAGLMSNAGWNVYFPHRDRGVDFIVSKTGVDGNEIIRPVQVKGKYPSVEKGDKTTYGYVGRLNQDHPDMVLAIPFFAANQVGPGSIRRIYAIIENKAPLPRLPVPTSGVQEWKTSASARLSKIL